MTDAIKWVAIAVVAVVAGVAVWQVTRAGKTAAQAVGDALDAVNPLNPDNIFKRAADSVVQAASGDSQATLGAKLFEVLNPDKVAAERALSAPIAPAYQDSGDKLNDYWRGVLAPAPKSVYDSSPMVFFP